jgi:hypothetical protein
MIAAASLLVAAGAAKVTVIFDFCRTAERIKTALNAACRQ